jgi:hypothetical protein
MNWAPMATARSIITLIFQSYTRSHLCSDRRANKINILANVERFGVLFGFGLSVGRAVNVRPFAQQPTHGTCRGHLLHDPQTDS